MNYFLKFRFAIWAIVALSLIILVTVGTMFYFMLSNRPDRHGDHPQIGHFFQKELGFSPEQERQAKEFRNAYFNAMKPVFDSLEQKRVAMIDELSKPKPDTLILNRIADEVGSLHAQLKRNTIKQLLKLRGICTPQQVEKLNILNKKILGPEGAMYRRRQMDNHHVVN